MRPSLLSGRLVDAVGAFGVGRDLVLALAAPRLVDRDERSVNLKLVACAPRHARAGRGVVDEGEGSAAVARYQAHLMIGSAARQSRPVHDEPGPLVGRPARAVRHR